MDTAARIAGTIARDIQARPEQVRAAVALLDEGATVPFVARYRKEATGGLDDGQLRTLSERLDYLRELEARRATILESIRGQDKLTDDLAAAISRAETKAELEDIYLPYKPKRRTKAMIARENGLEPLAQAILADRSADPETLAAAYVTETVPSVKEALTGARDIIAEGLAENAALLGALRDFMHKEAQLRSHVVEGKEGQGAKFSDYFDHSEKWATVPSHRALAMLRAQNEGIVTLDIGPDPETGAARAEAIVAAHLDTHGDGPGDIWLRKQAGWTWRVKLSLTMMVELMADLRARAQDDAIAVFARNLKDLLFAAPAGPRPTLGLDPGIRTGVKVAVVDATGKLLATDTVYPFQPRNDVRGTQATLARLIAEHRIELIAIGNGTASRETERLVGELLKLLPKGIKPPTRVVVSEAGASVYSASELAAREFPDLDVSLRGAVSIARRLQDPLAELVALPLNRFCLTLCGATILKLENSGGIVVSSKKHWSPGSDVAVQSVERSERGGWIVSGVLAPNGICPDCGLHSRRRHGWRRRRLQDYPAHGDEVTVDLAICRWRCQAPACPRQTFSDQIASIARPFALRTSRVGEIVTHLGHATGGRPAERLLHRLGLGVSDDTVLRQLKNRAQDSGESPTVIGIDDWSWRKSQTYGTIIVDLERRVVIDILEDRDVVSCTNWLKRHPEVEVISRDRCGLYAQAARQGAPQAKQVADRFHIVQNLRQAIEEQMNLHGRATGRALLSDADNITAAGSLLKSRLAHRASRDEIFATIHVLRNQGLSCSEIGRRTGFPRRSIAKWLQFETPPDRRRAALKPTSPWYFEDFLRQSWKGGIRTGSALFRLIRERGYEGSQSHLQRLLAGWRRAEQQASDPKVEHEILKPVRDPETGHAISPVIAAALCIKPRGKLTSDQARKVDALKIGSPAFATMRSLAMRFNGIPRGRQADPLPAWIDDAIETDLAPIVRFARTLNRDFDAVKNAIEMPWSNGQAEGQINRLKTPKRAMYDRASPELLRARMLPFRHTD